MDSKIQGLGWFLRRTGDPIALGRFYETGLGLPKLRSWDMAETSGFMLWAGDVCVLETNRVSDDPVTTPTDSQCIPVFRTHDLDESMQRLEKAGATPASSEEDQRATSHFYHDTDGFPFGIEYIKDDAIFEIDTEATRAWQQGKPSLPGGIHIDGNIQTLSRVLHLTSNTVEDATLLVDCLGLSDLGTLNGHKVLGLGSTAILELRHSDKDLARPGNRDDVHDTWIVREYGHQDLTAALRSRGYDPIDSLQFQGGDLDYYVTPSNRLFGFQQRRPYDPDVPTTQMVEDLAARSRWQDEDH